MYIKKLENVKIYFAHFPTDPAKQTASVKMIYESYVSCEWNVIICVL